MAGMTLLCRSATPFTADGAAIDVPALRWSMQRFVESRLGVMVGSGGSGEGHTLTRAELQTVYRTAVEVCKGKVLAYANPPEQYTAKLMIEHMKLAYECGIECCNLYGFTVSHGFKPTDAEIRRYFEMVLAGCGGPVGLAPNQMVGYLPKAAMIADLVNRNSNVIAVNLTGVPGGYFFQLKDLVKRKIEYFVPITGSADWFRSGAQHLMGTDAVIIPKTFRAFIDAHEAGNQPKAAEMYEHIHRYLQFVAPWANGPTRAIKLAMKVLKLPGGEGGMREPYLMAEQPELDRFRDGMLRLGISEVEELARAAGLAIPRA